MAFPPLPLPSLENPARIVTIETEHPAVIYRAGKPSPSNLTPRPIDEGKLSFRDSLSNPWPLRPGERPLFDPGEPYFGVDASRLPPGSVIPDNDPPGHVYVGDVTPEQYKDAVVVRGMFPK